MDLELTPILIPDSTPNQDEDLDPFKRPYNQCEFTVPATTNIRSKNTDFANDVNSLSVSTLSSVGTLLGESCSVSTAGEVYPEFEPLLFRRHRNGSISSSDSDLTSIVSRFFETTDLNLDRTTEEKYKAIQRWVSGTPSSPPAHSTSNSNNSTAMSEMTQSTAGTAPSTAPVTTVVMTPELRDTIQREQDCADQLLLPRGQSNTDDLNGVLYHTSSHHESSRSSSPLTTRRSRYTIVPMKPVIDEGISDSALSKQRGNDALGLVLSALYGKLLVVMGIAFPMSEVISTYIPPSFYDGFYLYLYFGSITFMICIYGNVLSQKATRSVRHTIRRINTMRSRFASSSSSAPPDVTTTDTTDRLSCDSASCSESPLPSPVHNKLNGVDTLDSASATGPMESYAVQRIHFGSFYLRMGAVAFGIGSMIYSGLEFGQYFELAPDTQCHNFMIALTPAVRMIFTFGQMYFIFLNSKMAVSSVRLGAQFGLMHMIGTNMCVWLSVLIQETRHEILHFYNPDNGTLLVNYNRHVSPNSLSKNQFSPGYTGFPMPPGQHNSTSAYQSILENSTNALGNMLVEAAGMTADGGGVHHREKRGLRGPHSIYECQRTNIMGSLVQNASPFLFPCTIEYSLICAAILYVMWKSIGKRRAAMHRGRHGHYFDPDSPNLYGAKRSPHHYSVDCARANKGLFLGIFILVGTIISLILFFVLINRPDYQALATLEVNITELVLYVTATVAVLLGMCQVRELRFVHGRNLELDNILLVVSQTGSFMYNLFTIIGGHFTLKKNTVLVMMTALASLIQLLFQTLFILDASKREAATADQAKRKPGREVVTFLLVANLAMWLINTLEKSRADSHPVQLKFYGVWAWTIITHISMPLAIFYRFHSTVCLCEIWKKAYKHKPSYS